ncbi:putative late blight resistance protein homolog R1A-10 [Bidens hawaiensis]|uniref:putative late blight resistance protein homolog R1A-10 n=1 Tax=Bidens hawaiensis TaxID=980011 RepID=UPI00404A2908
MAYTGLELFMENLMQLSYHNNNRIVNNNTSILSKRPQLQFLYQELGNMIEILIVEEQNMLHEIELVRNLKRRLKDVAHEAHMIVGLFVYSRNYRNLNYNMLKYNLNFMKSKTATTYQHSLNLKDVMRSLKSIKEELITILDNRKMDSSRSIDSLKTQTQTVVAGTRNPLATKKVYEEMVVGLTRDAELLRDKLAEDQKQLDVVSIVGMGGLGKTTLATKLFNDPFLVYHFHIRAWVTVSQTYEIRDLLIQLVASICMKLSLTVQVTRNFVRSCIKVLCAGDIRKKAFHGDNLPMSLIEHGKEIAKKCHGLPLAVVVMAGVLAKEERSKDSWERIVERVSSYIVSDESRNMDIMALSYDHLPPRLRDCFLYLGGFPEDHKFLVRKLIWMWMAEGFVEEDGKRSLEAIGEDYLNELVDRNLVIVTNRKFNGDVKACSVHDLLRELCLERATKGHFCMKISTQMSNFSSMKQNKPRRIFTNQGFEINKLFHEPFPWVHSLLWCHKSMSLISITNRYFYSYPLLMMLDIQKC